MADTDKIDEDFEYLQNVQHYEQPHSSKNEPHEFSRTGGGRDHADDDESIKERLFGLTEMFPQPVRSAIARVTRIMNSFVMGAYSFACNFSWFAFSTAIILFAPIIIEYELNNKNEESKRRPRTYGPNTVFN